MSTIKYLDYTGLTRLTEIIKPQLAGNEKTTNKVTSISSSSTDTQYPTAKCVYDLIGDIETLLSEV